MRARVRRTPSGALSVRFLLDADLERLRLPPRRARRFTEGLWRHTCFEVFVARRFPAYEEYNLSPSGEWARYAFRSYRKRASRKALPPRIRLFRNGLEARVEAGSRIGLAAVIEEKNGALSYWALRHPPGKPDFHDRRAFAARLA